MITQPEAYFNGTAPLNVTGAVRSCVYEINQSPAEQGVCTVATGSDKDSFLW